VEEQYASTDHAEPFVLHSLKHRGYVAKVLLSSKLPLSKRFVSLDASQPWICYWAIHSLNLLGYDITLDNEFAKDSVYQRAIDTLSSWQDQDHGGFKGGNTQIPHMASTYAAVMSLVSISSEEHPEALDAINREALYEFLLAMKQDDGSYLMHKNGEVDIRGVYCALSMASITNILTEDLVSNTGKWLGKCQSKWEGGFGGLPEAEAHGGYTYCGLAALCVLISFYKNRNVQDLLKEWDININMLKNWLVKRQMALEGGFQGRINKLVDGCYSFWVGACFPLIRSFFKLNGDTDEPFDMNTKKLQEYILTYSQDPDYGGFSDRAENGVDFYHTCYCLSGLSLAFDDVLVNKESLEGHALNKESELKIKRSHPLFNCLLERSNFALQYFRKKSAK
jgi:protein farnesyltransferase subunit beta